jgi:hypothetical protein
MFTVWLSSALELLPQHLIRPGSAGYRGCTGLILAAFAGR